MRRQVQAKVRSGPPYEPVMQQSPAAQLAAVSRLPTAWLEFLKEQREVDEA